MKKKTKDFLQGYASILNVFRPSKTKSRSFIYKSDYEQLYNDWAVVGNDMRDAMSSISKEINTYDR